MLTEQQQLEIVKLYQEGLSGLEIWRKLPYGKNTIFRTLERHGFINRKERKYKFSPEIEQEIIKMYQDGSSLKQIGEKLNCLSDTIRYILVRHKILRRKRGNREITFKQEEIYDILKKWQEGKFQSDIAKIYNVGRLTIGRVLRNNGVTKEEIKERSKLANYKGGRYINKQGYVCILMDKNDPFYCMSHTCGYVLEHRLIMARYLNRPISKKESVHHKNGNREDNRIENLQLRQGQHGKGICFKCNECGSENVTPIKIAD